MQISLGALALCAAVAAFSFHRHFRKTDKLKAPLINWMVVCMAAVAVAFMVLVHIANLLGFETGRR